MTWVVFLGNDSIQHSARNIRLWIEWWVNSELHLCSGLVWLYLWWPFLILIHSKGSLFYLNDVFVYLTLQVASQENESIQLTTLVLSTELIRFSSWLGQRLQLLIRINSWLKWKTMQFESTHDSTRSRTQVWFSEYCLHVKCWLLIKNRVASRVR